MLNGNRIGLERSVLGLILSARGTHEPGDPMTWASLVNCFGLSHPGTHTHWKTPLYLKIHSLKFEKKILKEEIEQRKKLLMDWLTLGFSLSPLQVYSLELQQKRKKKTKQTN